MGLKMLDLVLPDQPSAKGCLVLLKADEGGCCKAKKSKEENREAKEVGRLLGGVLKVLGVM